MSWRPLSFDCSGLGEGAGVLTPSLRSRCVIPALCIIANPLEQPFDYHLRITFLPPIAIHKGLRHVPYGEIPCNNSYIASVLIKGMEPDEQFVLSSSQTIPPVDHIGPMPVMKGCNFGKNLHLITPINS